MNTKKKLGRGYARWAGISKADRSKEMSRVAKELWKKIRAGDMTNPNSAINAGIKYPRIDTQA